MGRRGSRYRLWASLVLLGYLVSAMPPIPVQASSSASLPVLHASSLLRSGWRGITNAASQVAEAIHAVLDSSSPAAGTHDFSPSTPWTAFTLGRSPSSTQT